MSKSIGFFSAVVLFMTTSCTSMFLGLYGMKKPKALNQEQLIKEACRQGIPVEQLYQIDTLYWAFLEKIDTAQHAEVKNHSQPLQAMYFDSKGKLFRFYVNCYAGGFPNLKWNRSGGLNQFPPLPQAPEDEIFSFSSLNLFIHPLGSPISMNEADSIVVVFWNRMMGRQSKRFVQFIQKNVQLSTTPVRVLYVNTDELFLDLMEE